MLTETQKQLRRGKLGSSSAAAALGLDPFKSAADVYMELTGAVEDSAGNENTERGNLLEPAILKWCENETGKHFAPSEMFNHPNGLMCWNADGVMYLDDDSSITEAVECKSTVDDSGLGDEGTDQIKEHWLVQIAHAFAVVPTLQVMWVPVLLPGFKKFDFRLYRVDRNDELAELVEQQGLAFMRNHVFPQIPPSNFKPSLDVLKRVRRVPKKVVPVKREAYENWIAARAARLQAADDEDVAKAALITALGDAEAGEVDGVGTFTYMETHRKEFTTKESTYRTLRPVKAAKGKCT